MLLNRRTMLSASIGAIALGLSGCNSTRTTIVFANNGPQVDPNANLTVPIKVAAVAGGKKFNKTVAPGHAASQVYLSNGTLGSKIAITGTVTAKGFPVFTIPAGTVVTVGYTNSYFVDSTGLFEVVVT